MYFDGFGMGFQHQQQPDENWPREISYQFPLKMGGLANDRHEWLDLYMLVTIKEMPDDATAWIRTYDNHDSPNKGFGGSQSLRN
jgi:hypothetical protein